MDSLSANLQKKLWTAHKDPGRPPSYFYENSEELRADRKTVAETAREMRENDMALQEKKIMPPLWLAHREIERYSIGWRMGYGEDYIYRFGDWLDTLSPDERTEYRTLFPEPVTWKGWWDDEDSSEVLEHGDFWVNAWQPEGSPKYTRQWLQQEFSMGRKRELCLFWGHQPAEDGQLTKSCLSQWWMEDFYTMADSYLYTEQYMMAGKASA